MLGQAVARLVRLALAASLVGDRGLGRTDRLIRLATRRPLCEFRIDPAITASMPVAPDGALLATLLAAQPWLGHGWEGAWERRQAGPCPGRARALTATLRFSRFSPSGWQDEVQEAILQFLHLVPLDGTTDPLVLATTLPVDTLAAIKGVARLSSWRWRIGSGFETMKGWDLERFMVRSGRPSTACYGPSPSPLSCSCSPGAPAHSRPCTNQPAPCSTAGACSVGASPWASWPQRSWWTISAIAGPGPPSGSREVSSGQRYVGVGACDR